MSPESTILRTEPREDGDHTGPTSAVAPLQCHQKRYGMERSMSDRTRERKSSQKLVPS